jgi:cobalamin-dependent methionine synthase I
MGKRSGTAMKERNPGPVQEMAKEEMAAGAHYLDLNIGPARKDGVELMPWMVETVQAVTDAPLCLDTTNTDAMAAGFTVVKNKADALMNSISAQPERMEKLIPVAAEAGPSVGTGRYAAGFQRTRLHVRRFDDGPGRSRYSQ